jgi:hypothetical protein
MLALWLFRMARRRLERTVRDREDTPAARR